MLDVELYKVLDPGHFWCKPCSQSKIQDEQYYTLIGKINDYCCKAFDHNDHLNNRRSSIPNKGQVHEELSRPLFILSTSAFSFDRCWYRGRILSVFQTINGPQARVLLVDLGERTLIPGLWVQEIPEEFLNIPFQTMECVLSGLKPLTLVTSYFDLTTTKQPGDSWDVSATEWFKKQINGCSLLLDIKHIDEDGVHYVMLFATGTSGAMMCLNDELINKEFAVLSNVNSSINQDENKACSKKEHSQDVFVQEHREIIQQLNLAAGAESDQSDNSDSFRHASFSRGANWEDTSPADAKSKYQPITDGETFPRWSEPINRRCTGLSSDEESGRVRFLSARLPATGSSYLPDVSRDTKVKELRPILKTSRGYSSGEQEEVVQSGLGGGVRLPSSNANRYSPFAHEQEGVGSATRTSQMMSAVHSNAQEPSLVSSQGNVQSNRTCSSLSQRDLSSFVPTKLQDVSPTSQSASATIASTQVLQTTRIRPTQMSIQSPFAPTSSSQSSYIPSASMSQFQRIPTRSPWHSPRTPTPYPSESTSAAAGPQLTHGPTPSPLQSTHVPNSSSQSSRASTPDLTQPTHISTDSQSTSRFTPSPLQSTRDLTGSSLHTSVPTSPSQSTRILTPSPLRSPRVPSSPLPCSTLCHLTNDVFIHGEGLPRPLSQLDSYTFPEAVLRVLRDMCLTSPSLLQSNIWPAILRGRDVCGMAESSAENSMAYIPPVLTQIAEPVNYSELPLGNGPLALVLCPSWRKAATVYDQCCKFAKKIRNIRVEVVFGAGAEEEHILHLINGCEVIIATLPCFLRMLKKGYTRLDRLCHLVFDDADILAEEQTENIKELMRKYGGVIKSQPNRLAPRQCIALANIWTTGVASLVKAYLGNPLIISTNSVETAMFCKVRQAVQFFASSQKESKLVDLLDTLTDGTDHELIIFTSAAKDAERVSELLQYCSYPTLLAHEFMFPEQLVTIGRQWNTPLSSQDSPVLVMTDGVVDVCKIRNSSCVIHYDFPRNKKLFGKRLFCMAATYRERECRSIILGTEATSLYAQSIIQIVTRAGGEISRTLQSISEIGLETREERKQNFQLCYFLKALGECKNSTNCKERHVVFPKVDVSELLPRSGIVKVLVLKVMDACRYYVRILEHRSDAKDEATTSSNYYSGGAFLKLALDLNAWYGSPSNRHLCAKIHTFKLCVVECDGLYFRVHIRKVVKRDPETSSVLEVKVYFVDRGDDAEVSARYLLEIAPQFGDIPFQAVEAFVCKVKPVDDDKDWTNKSCRFVQRHIEGKELEGKVVMGLRNTIWIDPLVVKTHLKEINVTTNTFNVRLDLLKEGLAIRNPEHIKKLRKHLTSFVSMKHLTGQENSERVLNTSLVDTACLAEEAHELVVVPSVVNPGLFYARLDANSDRLQDLVDLINEEAKTFCESETEELAIGSVCLARFSEDNKWYRAKIFSIRAEGEYDVFFVDYGDREWISKDRIASIRPEHLQLPFQAIECFLVNISPVGSEWTEEDGDVLAEMTEDKLVYAKVMSKSAAMFAGTCRYGIELCDTSTERDVLLNHELIMAGHAQPSLESHKALFPEAFELMNCGQPKEHYEAIPEICLQLCRALDPNTKLKCAKEIKNIVSENMRKRDAIREGGGVRCIARLLGVSKIEAVQEHIVIALAFLASHNDQNCDEIRREGGLKTLCHLLTKTKSLKLQEHTAWAIKSLATSDRNRDATREFGGIASLCQLLEITTNEKVQDNVCWAIVALCADNEKNCDAVREAGGFVTLFSLLKTATNDSVLENVMWAISVLACNNRNKQLIGEQGGIETICSVIKNNQSEKVLKNAVRSLKTLSSYNDENRAIMYRLGVIDVMRKLTGAPNSLPFDTRRVCLDLIQRLLGRAPDVPLIEAPTVQLPVQEPIMSKPIYVTKKRRKTTRENGEIVNGTLDSDDDDLPPLEDTAEYSTPAVHPVTMWSQTKRFVSLSIKLRDVHDKVTTIDERNFYFRTTHSGKHYELNLDLFDNILPKESKVHVRGSEVLANLRKAHPSTWKRLLASPEKPPYLSIDFDRWDTDSSNDDEMPGSRIRQPMTKPSTSSKLNYVMPREHESDSDSDNTEDEEPTREHFFDFS